MSVLITAALDRDAVACGAPDQGADHSLFGRNIPSFNFASPDRAPGPLAVVAAD